MRKSEHTEHNKKAYLEALEKALGVKTTACRSTGVGRTTVYDWIKEDEEFRKAVEEIEQVALDFAESKLHKQISDGNTSATIFFLKSKGKKRGYVERQEITGVEGTPSAFKIEIIDRSEDQDE